MGGQETSGGEANNGNGRGRGAKGYEGKGIAEGIINRQTGTLRTTAYIAPGWTTTDEMPTSASDMPSQVAGGQVAV